MLVAAQNRAYLAIHSLFLLRQLELLSAETDYQDVPQRYFGLSAGEDGASVVPSDGLEEVDPLVFQDEELKQSDRFMESRAEFE